MGIFSTKQEQATNAYKVEANGKIQILEDSLELMEILIKYTSLLTPTATTEIIAPSDAISLNELIWGSFDYEDADYGDYDYNDWKEADRYFGGRLDEEEIAETMTDGIVEGDASAPFSIIVWVNKETKEQTTDRALIGTLTQKFGAAVNVVYLLVPADEYSSGSVILNHQSGEYVIVNQQDLTSFQEAVRYLL
ncbi:MAG: hypothetical protein LBI53_03485 [Candidatus Peribacteria bacterium]|nr:hypothetical protein [Candidatus Peribacteria bacterium]